MMIAVGKKEGRFIIGSGKGFNPGSLAGGAPGAVAKGETKGRVFGNRSVFSNFRFAVKPGGLIDKRQQADPASTVFAHPFDNGGYRSIATIPPRVATTTNNGQQFKTLGGVPEIMPHERGRFFMAKPVPVVKTQFGAAKSGAKSDTAFHPQLRRVVPPTAVKSSYDATKLVAKVKPPSFESNGNLWGHANNSYIAGQPNSLDGRVGQGRWSTVKRSVV